MIETGEIDLYRASFLPVRVLSLADLEALARVYGRPVLHDAQGPRETNELYALVLDKVIFYFEPVKSPAS